MVRFSPRSLKRASLALALSALLVLAPGALARDVSMSASSPSLGGNGGQSTTITGGVPVAQPGTVAQTITQSFDPSRLRLTGSSGIVAPSGWTLSYSSDGTTFGAAPGTPSGWASIRAVRATGSISSGGDANGFQIASGTGTGSVPPSGAFSAAGGGDGWDVSFDDDAHVYNVWHHDGYWGTGFSTPGIDCHTRTGASCGPGWPFSLRIPAGQTGPGGVVGQPWYHTNDESMSWVDTANARVWIPTNLNDGLAGSGTGFVCVDVSDLTVGPGWCGGNITNAFVRLGPTLCGGRNCALGLAAAAGKLFAWDTGTGDLICLDPLAERSGGLPGAACTGQPFSFTGITSVGLDNQTLTEAQGMVWGSAAGTAICFDPVTLAECSGWSGGPASLAGSSPWPNMVFDVPQADGSAGAVCFVRTNTASPTFNTDRGCFAADGSSSTALTGSHAGSALMSYVAGATTSAVTPKAGQTSGTRIYWSDAAWFGGGKIYCFDTSLASGAGAACANWPVSTSAYTATIDSQNPNCIWTNTDSGAITTIDAVTGGSTCVTPPSTATFSAPVMVPRLACTQASSIRQWRNLRLIGPSASTYSTATVTVLTASGQVVSGWNRVPIPAGSRTVDLSGLSVQASGLSPQFRVALADKTTNDPIQAEVSVVGDAPQLCLPLEAQAACPVAPARVPGAMPTPAPAVVTGRGQAQPSSGPAEEFDPGTASIAMSAPSDASCLGTISGTATMQGSSSPVPGATMRLLDSGGAVVATTTTDPTGAYAFDRLTAGSGYRVEFGPTSQGAADPATDASATTDRSVAVGSSTTVNGVYGLLRTNPLSGRSAHATNVTLTPAPHTSAGVQDYSAFSRAATCVIDPVDRQCKASVIIAGEGTWSVDVTTGALTFTPGTAFSGGTTPVAYRVTEAATSDTTWNWAEATIDAPVAPAPTGQAATSAPGVRPPVLAVTVPRGGVTAAARTGRVVSRIIVPGAGRVTQVGTPTSRSARAAAPVACRAVPVTTTGAGAVTVRCMLTPALRTALGRGAVNVTLVTRFTASDGTTTVTRRVVRLPRSRAFGGPPVTG